MSKTAKRAAKTAPATAHFENAAPIFSERVQIDPQFKQIVCGPEDAHLVLIAAKTKANIKNRNDSISISGDRLPVEKARTVLQTMLAFAQAGTELDQETIIEQLSVNDNIRTEKIVTPKKTIWAVKPHHGDFFNEMLTKSIAIGAGPAGTGKTYQATMMGCQKLSRKQVDSIIVTRPAVTTEDIGFLPGDVIEKMMPFMRPVFKALNEAFGKEVVLNYMASGKIEILPIAYMRGASLEREFMIVDEGQNLTVAQMKMALTRIGGGSQIVVTGDTDQSDLPANSDGSPAISGLADLLFRLENSLDKKGIGVTLFDKGDIVRSEMCQRVVSLYETPGAISQYKL